MKKKIICIISALIFCSPLNLFAMETSADWSYVFHLQYKSGILAPQDDAKFIYDPIPYPYVEEKKPTETEYYGVILSIKGKENARFGFDKPTNSIEILGKSLFDVRAPKFANADVVKFYKKDGKHLFDISVKGSSFCDDNNKCNPEVGEDYLNCPHDCPPPPVVPTIITPVTPISTSTIAIVPTNTQTPATEATTHTPIETTATTSTPLSKTQITLIVLGVVFLILVYILWKLRKFSDD